MWSVIRHLTVITKMEVMYAGPFGIAGYLAGLTYIKRTSNTAKDVVNNAMTKLIKDKTKVWFFPEGTRRNTGEIHNFKKGAFHLAIDNQIPIVPVVFSTYKYFLNHEKKIFNSGEIIMTALPEISTKGLTSNDIDILIEKTKKAMTKVYKRTSDEVSNSNKLSE
jgi:lysophosphatidate acyltransferase